MDSQTELYRQVALDNGVTTQYVDKCHSAFWKVILDNITAIDLYGDEDLTEEEFNKYNFNFNISSIGKLHLTYNEYLRIRKGYRNAKNKKGAAS